MLDFANDVNDDGVVTISLTPMIASREEGERRVCCGSNQTYERA